MDKRINLKRTTVNINDLENSIDTSFSHFVKQEPVEDPDTIENLFRLYDKLYFSIPVLGENSHQELVLKSSELYTEQVKSENIQPLLDEITSLREQLLDANQQISELTQLTSNV